MGILTKKTPWQKAYRALWKREQAFLRSHAEERSSVLDRLLEEKVPETLRDTLRAAFVKAFALVFEKGEGAVRWAAGGEKRRQTYRVQHYAAEVREDCESLKAFSKSAAAAGRGSVALAGAEGIGLGLLGVGIPDIPLFTAMLLKSLHETAESFGYPVDSDRERLFVLRLIQAALSDGGMLAERDRALNEFLQTGDWAGETDLRAQTKATAETLADALLVRKFLQGIPVAGAVGGAYDAIRLRRVQKYAAIKYEKRFLLERKLKRATPK